MTLDNAEDIILAQNPELKLQKGDIQTKFIFKTKRNTRNLVVETNSQTRRQMLQNKLKVEWFICNIKDYVSFNRCFKCSWYNHRHTLQEWRDLPSVCRKTNWRNSQHRGLDISTSTAWHTTNTTKIGKSLTATHHLIGTVPVCRQWLWNTSRIQTTKVAQADNSRKRTIQGHKTI